MNEKQKIPQHLKKYIVEQDSARYTPIDQAVWRYVLRQLVSHLSIYGVECYRMGLLQTGIEIDHIPDISAMDLKLQKLGWRAVAVSGFIPPAAFMEFQSLCILPIACDMRSIDHLMYTPAPDIVHEAAGHAPILVHPGFSTYLKKYAQVAKKAIISSEDLELYEAIRHLSDIKEDPRSTPEQIEIAEANLKAKERALTHVSEAALLSRMNWWTAEYGLIGTLENPKIFGAGLLSSLGEARSCLTRAATKIPFDITCVDYSYNITEPQPQLFVTPDFKTLENVLEELAKMMAFNRGGKIGIERALQARSVNTVVYSSGLQVSGQLSKVIYLESNSSEPIYLSFTGPCQLSFNDHQLAGHDKQYHCQGFGSPVGKLLGISSAPENLTLKDLINAQIIPGKRSHLTFESGVQTSGVLKNVTYREGQLLLLSFEDVTVSYQDEILFQPQWGSYDMAIGGQILSVFGGPADRSQYGDITDFVVKKVSPPTYSSSDLELHGLYQKVRNLRQTILDQSNQSQRLVSEILAGALSDIIDELQRLFPRDWLIRIELYELTLDLEKRSETKRVAFAELSKQLRSQLNELAKSNNQKHSQIEDGVRLAELFQLVLPQASLS